MRGLKLAVARPPPDTPGDTPAAAWRRIRAWALHDLKSGRLRVARVLALSLPVELLEPVGAPCDDAPDRRLFEFALEPRPEGVPGHVGAIPWQVRELHGDVVETWVAPR